METNRFTLRIPKDLSDKIKQLAAKETRSMHGLILHWLKECVRRAGG